MKNVIRKIVCFLLVFTGVIVALSLFAVNFVKAHPTYAPERERVKVRVSNEKEDTLDVLLVGDSESYTSFSPLQVYNATGTTAYDCGQTGQKPVETYYMLKTAFKTQHPKIVLLESDVMYEYYKTVREINFSLNAAISYYIPVYRYHDFWRLAIDNAKDNLADFKGFQIRPSVKKCTNTDYMTKTDERSPINGMILYYIDRIRELCKSHGAELILYSSPSPNNFSYSKFNAISDYANEHGLTYIDLNQKIDEMGIDWAHDSLDGGNHMNIAGCQKTTAYLLNYMEENYTLPDHRDDSAYASWNQAAADYQQAVDQALSEMKS